MSDTKIRKFDVTKGFYMLESYGVGYDCWQPCPTRHSHKIERVQEDKESMERIYPNYKFRIAFYQRISPKLLRLSRRLRKLSANFILKFTWDIVMEQHS